MININVKSSKGDKFSVQVETSLSVADFKKLLHEKSDIPPEQQRVIYSGHVLKDHQLLSDFNIQDGHTVHLVKGAAPPSPPPPTEQAPNANTTPPPLQFPGMPSNVGQMLQNPMMQDLLNSPMFQNLFDNPDTLKEMMMNNPEIREVINRNPEMAQVLNDPRALRQSFEMMRNPELMREMMRNADRAMINIENHPEGFNLLRRMYTNVQEPLLNAANQQAANQNNNPFSNLFNNNATTANPSQPLPNPWAPQPAANANATNPTSNTSPTSGTTQPSTTSPNSNPFGAFGGMGGGGMGGMGGMLGGMTPEQMNTMLSNPAVQGMMQQVMSNPQFLQQTIDSNPMLRQMVDQNPQVREMLTRPETLEMMRNPQTLQAVLQLQQAMGGMGGGGMGGGGMGGMGGGMPNLEQMMNAMGGMGGFEQMMGGGTGGMGGFGGNTTTSPAANQEPPEQRFSVQLQQLQDMGFIDQQENIQALLLTGGNVNAAIERLLR